MRERDPIPKLTVFIVSFCILALCTIAAMAHDAIPTAAQPLGWKYPYTCCSGIDCRPVNTDASPIKVETRPEGYVISATGEVIPYGDKKIKPSPDGDYHWCSQGGRDDGKTICLFVPPPGS